MPQVFAVWTAATLMLSLGCLTAIGRDGRRRASFHPSRESIPRSAPTDAISWTRTANPVFWLGTTQWQLFNP